MVDFDDKERSVGMKTNQLYEETLHDLRAVERKINCLEQCFLVISHPETVDSVNYQLLSLQLQRKQLFERLRALNSEK